MFNIQMHAGTGFGRGFAICRPHRLYLFWSHTPIFVRGVPVTTTHHIAYNGVGIKMPKIGMHKSRTRNIILTSINGVFVGRLIKANTGIASMGVHNRQSLPRKSSFG